MPVYLCPDCNRNYTAFATQRRVRCLDCADARAKARNAPRAAAQKAVNREIKAGRLIRQPCEICGAAKTDAHHDDYSQPLNVRWLCRSHHKLHHLAQARAERAA